MSDTVRESLNNLDRLFLDALVAGEYEYWTDAEFITEDDIWEVLGPIHPDTRRRE